MKATFLQPVGPSPSFFYPRKSVWNSIKDVLCMVNPVTPTGRIYNLTENVLEIINAFLNYNDIVYKIKYLKIATFLILLHKKCSIFFSNFFLLLLF